MGRDLWCEASLVELGDRRVYYLILVSLRGEELSNVKYYEDVWSRIIVRGTITDGTMNKR